jgi:small nuclear ribonucleoprotein (snRNP)-like protein
MHNKEKLMVVLRDGRKLIGILRSFDQFGKKRNCN